MNKLISLDAFKKALERIKDYVDSKLATAGGKADWNAQEGEDGYIKNKTHYEYTQVVQPINEEYRIPIEVNLQYIIYVGNTHPYYKHRYIKLKKDLVINNKLFISKDTLLGHLHENGSIYNIQDCITDFNLGGAGTSETTIIQENDKWFIKHYNDDYYDDIIMRTELKCIDEKYISNTVLKTIPQTLIDNDKNQALSNLGIDPVFWKYVYNPCIVPTSAGSYTLPSDLQDIIADESGNLIPSVVLKCIIFNIDDAYLIPTGVRPNTIHFHTQRTAIYSQGTLTFIGD